MKLTDQEQVILKAVGQGVAEVSRVIRAVGYPKATVKKVLVRLSEKGIVALHRHDWPASLKPEQRKLMVRIGRDYFNAVSMRKRNPQSKSKKALKTTGRALKSFAKGALSAGAQILGAGATALNPHGMSEKAWKAEENKWRKSIAAYRAKGWTYQQIKDRLWLKFGLTLDKLTDESAVFVPIFGRSGGFTLDLIPPLERRRMASKAKNKTIIKAKRVVVLNPKRKPAKKAVKRKRNLDHKDSRHQVEVSKHWRAGGLSQWQRAHKAGQKDLFGHGIKARNPDPKHGSKTKAERLDIARQTIGSSPVYIFKWVGKWHQSLSEPPYHATGVVILYPDGSVKPLKRVRNASKSRTTKSVSKRRAGASRKTANRSRVRSVAKARKAPVKRASKRAVKKSSGVKGKRNPTPAVLAVVNRAKSKAAQNRKEFAGEYRKDLPLRYPEGTPQGLSKLGKLLKIKTDRAVITPINNQTWLVRDLKGKLHIGTTSKDGLIWSGAAEDFGHVRRIEYEDVKKHLGYDQPQGFYHFMGEEDGIRPRLYADGKGGLKFKGGNYRITPEGIVN
jgi:hypothetical protein